MSDLLRFEIWQVFLLENHCDVCVYESMDELKLALGYRIALEAKW